MNGRIKQLKPWQFVWNCIEPYKYIYIAVLLAPIISSFYPLAYNYILKLILDIVSSDVSFTYQDLVFPVSAFVAVRVALEIVWRISNYAEMKAIPYTRKLILTKSYDYVQYHNYEFFQREIHGVTTSKLKGILDGFDKLWGSLCYLILRHILIILINVIALIWVKLELGLFVAIWAAIFTLTMHYFSKRLQYYTFLENQSRHRLIGSIADRLGNIASIFAYTSQKNELAVLNRQIDQEFTPRQLRSYRYNFFIQLGAGLFHTLMMFFLLFLMISYKKKGIITTGDFVLVFNLVFYIADEVWHLVLELQSFIRNLGDFYSSFDILSSVQESDESEEYVNPIKPPVEIVFEDINFTFPSGKKLFDNFNLTIKEGEKIGIVGHAGSGKSTIISLLLGYYRPQGGTIKLNGHDIHTLPKPILLKNIALIPQDINLFQRSLKDNISYGSPHAEFEEIIQAAKKANIHDFICSLPQGYDTELGQEGLKLSGGQRQRIAIARAILKNAPILVLDEATSSLDSQSEKYVQESLNHLIQQENKTVIAIAHRFSTLRNMDKIIVLDNGKKAEEGKHSELYSSTSSLYRQLWDLQVI